MRSSACRLPAGFITFLFFIFLLFQGMNPTCGELQKNPHPLNVSAQTQKESTTFLKNMTRMDPLRTPGPVVALHTAQAKGVTTVNNSVVLIPEYPGGTGYFCNCSHEKNISNSHRCTDIPAYTIFSPGSYQVGADQGNHNCSVTIQAPHVVLDGNSQTTSGITISPGASDAMVMNFFEITGDGLCSYGDNSSITNNTVFNVNNQGISIYGSKCIVTGNTVNNNHIIIETSNKTA